MDIETSGFLTSASIGGLMFVFAGRDIIANLFGSFMMIMSKKFDIGDTISVKGVQGIVEEVTLDHTKIMSMEGKVVYMPNKIIITEQVENLSRRRFFTYTYKVPLKKEGKSSAEVHDILMLIEGKIWEYFPITVTMEAENPNASDFVYIYTVSLPEENADFDRNMQRFLVDCIFLRTRDKIAK